MDGMNLGNLQHAMEEGDCIGSSAVVSNRTLESAEVVPALLEVGNDSEFFNGGLDEEGAPSFPVVKKVPAANRMFAAQSEAGWNDATVAQKALAYLNEIGMLDTFAAKLERDAAEEAEMTAEALGGPGVSCRSCNVHSTQI